MSKFFWLGLFLLSITLLNSCSCEKEEVDNAEPPSAGIPLPTSLASYSPKVRELVKSDTGIIRGVVFGTSLDIVQAIEDTGSMVELGEDYINYSVLMDSLEEADVLYFFNEDKAINKIEVDIYPKDEESRASLYQEFATLFSSRYGEPTSEIEEVKIWNVPDHDLIVEMRMLGNAKVHDLQIDFRPVTVPSDPQ